MIRKCKKSDLEFINRIRTECGKSELSHYEIRDTGKWITFVKIVRENIVAYLTIRPQEGIKDNDCQFDVFVHPREQGKGVGTELIKHAIDITRSSTLYNRLTLGVETGNVKAIGLYQNLGFVEFSRNMFGITMVLNNR